MEDNTPTENDDRGYENGLKWKEIFESADVDERAIIFLRSSLVNQLYHGAISSIEIVNEPLLSISILDEPFQSLILSPIEWFLFGEEPIEARKKLLEFNNPPTICAKIFKNGEPTYTCRDCGLDATCVLCMQCFGKSIHKDHNYMVSTSSGGGGGCCDCGDSEAWKQGASCELHAANPENSAHEDPLKKLPQQFVDRAKYLFSIVLDYCVNVICQPDNEELLPELKFNFASNDSYATVLFNDESHTFNDVIFCLTNSFSDCTKKMAMEFATIVDQEGRSIVFVGNFESCSTSCQSVQENSDQVSRAGPLRCETLNLHLVACQLVALRLIKWVNDLTEQSDGLRRLHCLLCTTEFAGKSHLMRVLLADAKLWKAARFKMHELLMNMLLKDSLGKVSFGIEFVKNYSVIMNDFCADDQEHSISVTAMSVQIFTVPSLVQMLVVNYDVLEVVMKVLLQTSERFLGDNGVFDFKDDTFDKSSRLYHIITDLRYVLQNIGNKWNEVLKEKHLRFFELFLSFHRRFQGMRSTKRVQGHHVEFEPEWHRGISVQYLMADVLQLIAKWCKSDRDVLLRSVSVTLKCLKDIRTSTGETKLKKHEGEKSMKTLDFDNSSDYISIHIPIVRFLAGLIETCEIYSINILDLLEIKDIDDVLMYLAYPLKVLVMVAQVNAGMWKRNGHSILRQVQCYQKDLSTEMYDKDIFLMQALASCMNKDHFIIVLLDMFKLLPWSTSSSFDVGKMAAASLNQQLSLAAEFLHLLIILLGERYKCSVGTVDIDYHLRRLIIHKLCLGAMSRSQLMSKLPLAKYKYERGNGVDDVILSVTTFTKPDLSAKGMYKLKKEYFGEFNPFFYLYSKNEQSKAQEHQLARCKEEGISAAFVPPVPVQFSPLFANIVDLLSCRQLVDMLTVILWRIAHNNPKSWTDRIFHEVLHLIGLALHEETRQRENQQSFGFLTAARKQLSNECKYSLIECLEALQGNPIIDDHVSLLRWTIKKFNDECFARDNPGVQPLADAPAVEMAKETQHDEEKILKQRLAKERREKLLLQMSNMQKAFIRENSELYSSTNLDDTVSDQVDAPVASVPDHSTTPVIAIGNNRSPSVFVSGEQRICILCQEKPTSIFGGRPLVFSAYVQKSTNLSRACGQTVEHGNNVDPLVSHRDQRVGVHTSSCGHAMHYECWQRFFESQRRNKRLHSPLMLETMLDMANGEFLCPLCDGLSNTVVPLLLHVIPPEEERTDDNLSWVTSLQKIQLNMNTGYFSQPVDNSLISFFKEKLLTLLKTVVSVDMKSAISVFSQAAFRSGLNVEPNEEDPRVALMVWSTCAYTIQCFEHSARGENKPLAESLPKREMDALSSLVLISNSVVSVSKPSDVLNHCHRLISVLLGSEIRTNDHRSLMDIDLFDWMVKMRFSLPSLNFQNNSAQHDIPVESLSSLELDVFIFHLALIATITQILLTTPEDIPTDEMDEFDEADEEITKQLSNLWRKMKTMCSQQASPSLDPYPQRLLHHVRCRLLPFLRCCAIFFHILNSTRVPVALKENFMSFDKEYDALSQFLALPRNLTEIFQWNDKMGMFNNDLVTNIFARWCSNYNVKVFTETLPSMSLDPRHLIKLPDNFSELISYASTFDCPMVSRDNNRVPAMCLVCGKLMCSDTFCCKETINGKSVACCTAHAIRCGAGIGIFLRISDCVVLLINGISRACHYASPYLDAYGETDQGLKRGNPLYLCHERYERLEKLWKRHRIASEIARNFRKRGTFLAFE